MPAAHARTTAVASPAGTGTPSVVLRCRVFGHRYRFWATGTVNALRVPATGAPARKQDIPLHGRGAP